MNKQYHDNDDSYDDIDERIMNPNLSTEEWQNEVEDLEEWQNDLGDHSNSSNNESNSMLIAQTIDEWQNEVDEAVGSIIANPIVDPAGEQGESGFDASGGIPIPMNDHSTTSTQKTFLVHDFDTMEEAVDITGGRKRKRKETRTRHVIIGCALPIVLLIGIPSVLFILNSAGHKQMTKEGSNRNNNPNGAPPASSTDTNSNNSTGAAGFLPNVPLELGLSCGLESLQTEEGYVACVEACKVAECCHFPSSMDISCITGNEVKCLNYHEQCAKLNDMNMPHSNHTTHNEAISVEVPPAPNNLESMCSHEQLTFADFFDICKEACSKGECCYEKDSNITSCTSHPNCEAYAPCLGMAALDNTHDKIQEEVDQKCSNDNVLTLFGRNDCLEVCQHAACCFAKNTVGPCNHDNNDDFCTQYASCQNIFHITEDQINALCDPNTGDEGMCMQTCFPARCCFENNDDNDDDTMTQRTIPSNSKLFAQQQQATSRLQCAQGFNKDQCHIYNACSRLFESADDDEDDSPDDNSTLPPLFQYSAGQIRDACINHNDARTSANGRTTLCEVVCRPGSCCLDDDDEECDDRIDCSIYQPCLPNAANTISLKAELTKICSKEVLDKSECVEKCGEAACCFTIDPDRSCLDVGKNLVCSEYQPCDTIYFGV